MAVLPHLISLIIEKNTLNIEGISYYIGRFIEVICFCKTADVETAN